LWIRIRSSFILPTPATNAAFYGQDGHYVGRQPSYSISRDGLTVYDNVTGLTWTRSHDWSGDGNLNVDRVFNHVRLVRDASGARPDYDEFFVGTDPVDSGSVFTATLVESNLSWPSIFGREYQI
jgi:hypothetical protein